MPSMREPRITAKGTNPLDVAELREGLVDELQGLRARAMAGEDFAELARAHSKDPSGRHGGKLGEPVGGVILKMIWKRNLQNLANRYRNGAVVS